MRGQISSPPPSKERGVGGGLLLLPQQTRMLGVVRRSRRNSFHFPLNEVLVSLKVASFICFGLAANDD